MDNKPVYYSDERSNVCILCSWGSDAGPVVTIPSFVGGIYKTCFYQCKNLTHIKVDSANSYLVDIDGILYTKNMQFLVSVPPARESVEISEDIERMFEFAFRNCRNLTSIKIPNKVKCIEDAFGGCTSLRNVEFPDSLKSFAENAFSENEILKNITFSVSPNNTNITIVDNVVFAKGGKQLLRMLGTQTHYTIPDGVEEIAPYAFAHRDIRSIDIPKTIKSIGEGAFRYCESLENVTMYEMSRATIDRYAFGSCKSLKSIDIADGVTSIGCDAFEECSSLTHIGLPKSVSKLGDSYSYKRIFNNTSNMKEIVVDPQNKDFVVKDGVLFTKDLKTLIYCPPEKTGKYTIPSQTTKICYSAFSYSNLDILVISENIMEFEWTPFTRNRFREVHWMKDPKRIKCYGAAGDPFDDLKHCKEIKLWEKLPKKDYGLSLLSFDEKNAKCVSRCDTKATEVIIPEGIESIAPDAFKGCKSMVSIVLPSTLRHIGYGAFYNCCSLKSIKIPEGVNCIDKQTFEFCESLESVTIPDSVKVIGEKAFCECSSLAHVDIPNNVKEIGKSAFADCYQLKLIELPNGLEKIEDATFENCEELEEVVIPDSVKYIGDEVFHFCTNLIYIEIPNSVREIGESAFCGCDVLKYADLSRNMTCIKSRTFLGCQQLEYVYIPDSVTSIESEAFCYCTKLESVLLPKSIKNLGEDCFKECKSLKTITLLVNNPENIQIAEGSPIIDGIDCNLVVPIGAEEAYRNDERFACFKKTERTYDTYQDARKFTIMRDFIKERQHQRYRMSVQKLS